MMLPETRERILNMQIAYRTGQVAALLGYSVDGLRYLLMRHPELKPAYRKPIVGRYGAGDLIWRPDEVIRLIDFLFPSPGNPSKS